MTKKTKNPELPLRIRYKSRAGTKTVKCVPVANLVTIGNESWKVPAEAIYFDKGKPTADCVQGRTEAQPVWGKGDPLTPEELDAIAHNNALEQFNSIARGGQKQTASWVVVGAVCVVFLAVLGFGIKLSGDVGDLRQDLALQSAMRVPSDTTTVNNGQPANSGNGFHGNLPPDNPGSDEAGGS